jgi:hypothetical protein
MKNYNICQDSVQTKALARHSASDVSPVMNQKSVHHCPHPREGKSPYLVEVLSGGSKKLNCIRADRNFIRRIYELEAQ